MVALDRPGKRNAIRRATYEQLLGILGELEHDDEIRALILTGAGDAFSAGIDVEHLDELLAGPSPERALADEIAALAEITRRMLGLPAVVIAAVNGPAIGLGVELALAADLRVASERASFALPEAALGFFVTSGALYLLPRLVGRGRAADMLLTGEVMSAGEAREAGLVTRVTPHGQLLRHAREVAHRIAAGAPLSIRLLKDGLGRAAELDLEACMRLEGEALQRCMASADAAGRIRAFVERRAAARRERGEPAT